ncbi:MAG TPA: FAD-dependent oxidoreductase [Kiritimatiellia bacterium]|nr:FAD-dependent oxidoreductase [Kiritimatiellia bacterium]
MVVDIEKQIREAEWLVGVGKFDDAIDALRTPDAPNDARRCTMLAKAYHARGDTRGDVYSSHYFALRALELGSADVQLPGIVGIAAFKKERYGEAVRYLKQYVTEHSGHASHHVLGLALLNNGQADEALPHLRRAVELAPKRAEYAEAVSVAESRAGKNTGDVRTWKRAPHGLGGPRDVRPLDVPTPYRSNAVSTLRGIGTHAKDHYWLEKNIPCQKACPAGTDIPGYLGAIYRGEYDRAYKINLHDNVFPAVLGRVCSRPCESECRHGWQGLGEPVAICFSKRSAADFKSQGLVVLDPWFPPTGKKVAVVGAGVGGLAAARNLALMGHSVTVYEKHNKPGGMMNQGIPEFRLPRDVIDQEIEQVRRQGVKIVCNAPVGPELPLEKLVAENDAVVLAAGTLRPNLLNLPGHDLKGIRHGLSFLLEANEVRKSEVGSHIVVIGGGFTAMDCARTAARLGADTVELEFETTEKGEPVIMKPKGESVKVLYRRSQAEMLITPGELEELNHEGIPMHFMVSPKAFVDDGHGRVKAMRFVRTELGDPDAGGRRKPVEVPGSEFEIPADTILLATGQFPGTEWIEGALREKLVEKDEWLKSGRSQKTAIDKVFVAGDFATGASSLIQAIAHGKESARAVDTFLMGEVRLKDVALVEDVQVTGRIREMDYVNRQPMPTLPIEKRSLTAEVETGFDPALAVDETQRCYLCHYKYEIDPDKCIYCDWCIKAKPRPECIVKVSDLIYDSQDRIVGYTRAKNSETTKLIWINQADCIRCNACVEACPVDAISVQRVNKRTIRADDRTATIDLPVRFDV